MPQLDSMHFFTQFFWLCLGSFFLYFYLFHFVLPQLYSILIYRKKKLFLLEKKVSYNKEHSYNIQQSHDNIFLKCFVISNELIMKTEKSCEDWYINLLRKDYVLHFNKANLTFLRIFAELHYFDLFSKQIMLEAFFDFSTSSLGAREVLKVPLKTSKRQKKKKLK